MPGLGTNDTNTFNGVANKAGPLQQPVVDSQSTRSLHAHVEASDFDNTGPRGGTGKPALEQTRSSNDDQPRPSNMHAVRGFTPEPIISSADVRQSTSTSQSISGLSASLASASMHHPRKESQSLPPPKEPVVDFTHRVDAQSKPGASVLNFKRKTDDGLDMATSYRFFLVEEQMQKRHLPSTDVGKPVTTPPTPANPTNGQLTKIVDPTPSNVKPSSLTSTTSPISPSGKSKKKVVTFDVEPAVVTITREVDAEKVAEAASNLGSHDLVFDLEEDDPGYASGESSMPPYLREPIVAPRQSNKVPRKPDLGLSTSYQAVRPASLPNPSSLSTFRPSVSRAQVSSPLSQPPSQPTPIPVKEPKAESAGPKPDDPRDQEILRLVAADVPSHRGAWKRDTKAWETFTKRPDHRRDSSVGGQEEAGETEETFSQGFSISRSRLGGSGMEESTSAYIGSLPVAIRPVGGRKQELSLASYKPKSALESASLTSVPTLSHRRHSSAAMRRAAYAERDKLRSLDPGALDFAVDEESDDQGDDTENSGPPEPGDADKGSRYALRILHARSSIPEAGVWASLA